MRTRPTQDRQATRWETSPTRGLTSGVTLFFVVLVVYVGSPISQVDYDPKFASFAAASLTTSGDLDLEEFDPDDLTQHPLLIVGPDETSWGVFNADQIADHRRSGARTYDYFPWVSSLLLVPANVAVALASGLGVDIDSTPDGRPMNLAHRLTASTVVAAAAVVMMHTARRWLAGGIRRRRVLASGIGALFAFGTAAWSIASRALWQHCPSLLFVASALYVATCLVHDDRPIKRWTWTRAAAPSALGASLGLAVIARPTNIWLAVGVTVWVVAAHRNRLVPFASGALAVAAAFVAVNLITFRSLAPLYYAGSRLQLHDQFATAWASQWVSPSRGLLWTTPFLILAVPGFVLAWRRPELRGLLVALAVPIVGISASVSGFHHWWAGHSTGARFMTEAVPLLMVLAIPAFDRMIPNRRDLHPTAVVGVAVLVALCLPAVIYHAAAANRSAASCWNVVPNNIDEEPSRIWGVSDSQFVTTVGDLVGHRTRSSCPL